MEDSSTVQSVIKNKLIYQREEEIDNMVESRTFKWKIIIKKIHISKGIINQTTNVNNTSFERLS